MSHRLFALGGVTRQSFHTIFGKTSIRVLSTMDARPFPGVGVFVFNAKKQFLTGKRLGSHGSGTWGLPGGHLEHNEDFVTCGARETEEETGLKIKDGKVFRVVSSYSVPQKVNAVTIFVVARVEDEEAKVVNVEEDKCAGWRWQTVKQLIETHEAAEKGQKVEDTYFAPMLDLIKQYPDVAEKLEKEVNALFK